MRCPNCNKEFSMKDVHGQYRYALGCRCEVCRKSKTEYMRKLRAKKKHLKPQPAQNKENG